MSEVFRPLIYVVSNKKSKKDIRVKTCFDYLVVNASDRCPLSKKIEFEVNDEYDGLVLKTISMIKHFSETELYTHLIKIDDSSVWHKNIDHSFVKNESSLFENSLDYSSLSPLTDDILLLKTGTRHYKKVNKESFWFKKKYRGPWLDRIALGGFGYILSKRVAVQLSDYLQEKKVEQIYNNHIYEDLWLALAILEVCGERHAVTSRSYVYDNKLQIIFEKFGVFKHIQRLKKIFRAQKISRLAEK